jgi:hypothetical protein
MKNPFKSFAVFVIMILTIALLGSCSASSHGYNYSQHSKKGSKLSKQAIKRNRGNDLVDFKCRGRH